MSDGGTCARDGCDKLMEDAHGNARYCSDACRSAAWRARTGYRLIGTSNACQTRKSARSGLQVSYRKMIDTLANTPELIVTNHTRADARRAAEQIVRLALSDKQRARLDGRT